MPKVTVSVSADLKARMDQHRARFDWPGAARAAWEALIESEEEREAELEARRRGESGLLPRWRQHPQDAG